MSETMLSDGSSDQGNDNSGSDLGWKAALPDDLKNHELIKDFTKPGEAIQAFVDLKKGTEGMVRIPDENATAEVKAAFSKALGRPDTAESYTFTKPENLPDGMGYSSEQETLFKTVFHELDLSDSQASKLWAKYHEVAVQGYELDTKTKADTAGVEQKAFDDAVNSLKDTWKGDAFKVNTERAHRIFKGTFENEADNEAAKTFLEETKVNGLALGDHPIFLRIFERFATKMGDDSINAGPGSGAGGELSDEEKAKKMFPNTTFPKT